MKNKTTEVLKYFNKQAHEYQNKSESLLWNGLRNKELNACFELLEPSPQESILDAGCGAGFYTRELINKKVDVIAVDLCEDMLNQLKNIGAKELIKGDITKIEFPNKFDKILCAGALEFCDNPYDAISNLSKSLKQSGRIVLLLPRKSFLSGFYYLFHKSHNINVHLFQLNDLIKYCDSIGLKYIKSLTPGFSLVVRFDKI